ncbi:hypothetical protein [Streptomyces sp. NPDC054961]
MAAVYIVALIPRHSDEAVSVHGPAAGHYRPFDLSLVPSIPG